MSRDWPTETVGKLEAWLAWTLDAEVAIDRLFELGGGAIQENWGLDVRRDGRAEAWVLRTDAPSGRSDWTCPPEPALFEGQMAA